MKKLVRILIILFILIAVFGAAAYIDYFMIKGKNTYPKLAIKKKLNEDVTVYTALLYKVWYCKTNDTYTIGGYDDKDAICPHDYEYVDGYYTNSIGIKISKKDIEMLSTNDIYTTEMIDNLSSEESVKSALHVVEAYMSKQYKSVNKKSEEGEDLVVFPTFELDKNTKKYSWVYDLDDTANYYCLSNKQVAKYDGEECGNFEKIKMDKEWCQSYEKSTLIYKNKIEDYCKERCLIAFEIGSNQKEDILNLISKYLPNTKVIVKKDLSERDRMVFIFKNIE